MKKLADIRVRVVRPHKHDCATRAKRAGWDTPWWLDGTAEYRTATGRGGRHKHHLWLVARCLFGDTYGRPVRGACKAMGVVNAMDLGDALTNARQLSTAPRRTEEKA